MTARIEHRVEYQCGIRFFPEPCTRRCETRDVMEALAHMPQDAWAFHFYDVRISTLTDDDTGEKVTREVVVAGSKSGTYYPHANVFTVADLEALAAVDGRDYRILINNIRGNDRTGTPRAVRCRLGNWQQLGPDDRLC